MTISNESRARSRRSSSRSPSRMGRVGLTPNALTLIGFAITVVGAVVAGRAAGGWPAGIIVLHRWRLRHVRWQRWPGRPARPARSARSWTRSSIRWGEAVVYLGIVIGAAGAGVGDATVLAAAAMGVGVHGQLHAGQVGGPRLHAPARDGRHRRDAARDPARHPEPRARRRRVLGVPGRAGQPASATTAPSLARPSWRRPR